MEIRFDERGIKIDGQYGTLLVSSLFYFRIPKERWGQRMKLLRTAGYDAIDVYFPWNYHETAPGEWMFDENRDIECFLSMAEENDLFVIARPGPYICSEWDGGAIPAWLYADGIQVRQDDPVFLSKMRDWYAHLLPILKNYQITKGGPIICMQIENELDFYDCKSPVTYMGKLKEMAETFGMEIPLFYCCGQDDIVKSGGLTEGLYSSFNVYASEDYPELERRALGLYEAVKLRGMPFMVTETNRDHSFLKRLLACGAKLLSPYNQTAGTTMDFYTGITNWGPADAPVSIMVTDYDFKSMIGSAGNYDTCIYKARLFAGLLKSFGDALATGTPKISSAFVRGSKVNKTAPMLQTDRGCFLDVSNLGEAEIVEVELDGVSYPVYMDVLETKLLPVQVKITRQVTLAFANYEIASVLDHEGRKTEVWLYGTGDVLLTIFADKQMNTYHLSDTIDGRTLEIEDVLFRFGSDAYVSAYGLPFLPALGILPGEQEKDISEIRTLVCECIFREIDKTDGLIQPMEYFGQYRGVGRYSFKIPSSDKYLFSGMADIITIEHSGRVQTFYANGSTGIFHLDKGECEVMTEIWGHANFDDIRVKSLRMGSLKGIDTLMRVERMEDLTNNWRGYETNDYPKEYCFFRHSPYNAVMNADGFNRAASPLITVISRKIYSPSSENGLFLHFEKAACMISVYLNNRKVGDVIKDDPYINLSAYAGQGDLELTLHVVRRYYTDEIGRITLIGGKKIERCSYCKLIPEAGTVLQEQLPLIMSMESRVLKLYVPANKGDDIKLFFFGRNVKLTVFAGGHVMGRIYLSDRKTPAVMGGADNTTLILGEWAENGPVIIWCQPIGEDAQLMKITAKQYLDGVITG